MNKKLIKILLVIIVVQIVLINIGLIFLFKKGSDNYVSWNIFEKKEREDISISELIPYKKVNPNVAIIGNDNFGILEFLKFKFINNKEEPNFFKLKRN